MTPPTDHTTPSPERRRQPRVTEQIPLSLALPGLTLDTRTGNISSSGAYCEVEHDVPFMTKVALTILLPVDSTHQTAYHHIHCHGVVVRTEAVPTPDGATHYHLGIFFTELKARDRQHLVRFVERRLQQRNA